MWNNLDLKCPVSDVCEYGPEDGIILQDLPNLVSVLTSYAELLTQDHPFWSEMKVFQNVQAKCKNILHCDKCLQLLQRVGSCLRKMVLLNLSKSYLDLAEHILVGIQSQNTPTLIPSRQQLEYVLIRTQSAAKLICESLHYSREAFCYLIQRLKIGHLIINLTMAISATAKLNILFKGLLVQIFELYRNLLSWTKKLKGGTWDWPSDLNLPEDLEYWLKPEESELLKPRVVPKEDFDFMKKLIENHSENGNGKSINNGSEDECVIIEDASQTGLNDADLGEVIARPRESTTSKTEEDCQSILRQLKKAKTLKRLRSIWDHIIGEDHLKNLLTPRKTRNINKIFEQLKTQVTSVKKLNLVEAERKEQIATFVKAASLQFEKILGLPKKKILTNNLSQPLQSAETFTELKQLYRDLLGILQAARKRKKCAKLKREFKSSKADIKLMIENGEKETAKKLILCTSKVLLLRFQK